MSDIAKMEMPNFLMITHISRGKGDGEWIKVKARVNPYHITSYVEGFVPNYGGGEGVMRTFLFVSGQQYVLDMKIEEVDEMMENIDRSLSMKESGI